MRLRELLVSLFCLGVAQHAMADMPYVFQPRTPAKASEVNANFSALDSRLSLVEELLKPLQPVQPAHSPSVSYIPSDALPGQLIPEPNSGGGYFVIVRVPIADYESGRRFAVTWPAERAQLNAASIPPTSIAHCQMVAGNLVFENSTFQMYIETNESDELSVTPLQSVGQHIVNRYHKLSTKIVLKFAQTCVSFSGPNLVAAEHSEYLVPFNDFDFVDNATETDWARMSDDTFDFSLVDDLIDYVKVEELAL